MLSVPPESLEARVSFEVVVSQVNFLPEGRDQLQRLWKNTGFVSLISNLAKLFSIPPKGAAYNLI
jgi:hypothetical protein